MKLKLKIASIFSHQNSETKYQQVSGDQRLIMLIQLDALGRIANYGLKKNHENSHFLTKSLLINYSKSKNLTFKSCRTFKGE